MKAKILYAVVLIALGVGLGISYTSVRKKSKLDKYYSERFKDIKQGMIYGSSADNQEELSRYHDQTELCMHLDGYNAIEVMDIRYKAFIEAVKEGKK